MRTTDEIKKRIDNLMMFEEIETNEETAERMRCQIDALLWVIGDESGAPLLDMAQDFDNWRSGIDEYNELFPTKPIEL